MEFSLFEPIGFEYAVTASGSRGGHPVPIRMNRNGKAKRLPKSREGNSRSVEDYARLQGLPVDFLNSSPFTVSGKKRVLGNGVPLPTGRALANAVAAWLDDPRLIGGGS
jgi:site-specific DNA-cytosine methylase